LTDKLPQHGRLQYNSENIEPYRKDIDSVVQMLLRKSPNGMDAHKKTLSEIARRGSALSETGTKSEYVKRLTEEYKSRLGNVVLGMIKQYRSNPKSKLGTRGEPKTCKQHKAVARRRRAHGARVIQNAISIVNGGAKSVQADFRRELAKAERDIEFGKLTAGAQDSKRNRS
ncbi:MAG: relaxase MobL, partial [Clostridiales bacterium]|nr:relaxase MobL [Clostridiales bacterium]